MDIGLSQAVRFKEHGIDVPLLDGTTAYFNHYWLRDNCPTSFDSQTRERTFDIFHEAKAPKPAQVTISDGVLEIEWAGSGQRTRHPLARNASEALYLSPCGRGWFVPKRRSRSVGRTW